MNENSRLKQPAISDWLSRATTTLSAIGIPSARLDAEIILAHTIHRPRTYLHAHSDDLLDPRNQEVANARLNLRVDRVPIAYIIGHKEFYGRRFKVTTATLIPRPETEVMIDYLRDLLPKNRPLIAQSALKTIDIGTGSGCVGITAKLEFPELSVTLSDVSTHALKVARDNAIHHKAEVEIIKSNLLSDYPFTPSVILANLPYVDTSWDVSPETASEPDLALYANQEGLQLINQLLAQAGTRLARGGFALLEADTRQHEAIIKTAKNHGLQLIGTRDLIVALTRPV